MSGASRANGIGVLDLPVHELPAVLEIPAPSNAAPTRSAIEVNITPPGSKSLTNRALVLAALASGRSTIRGALVGAEDSHAMIGALRALGATITPQPGGVAVDGVGGVWRVPPGGVTLDVNNAGTAARFLAASAMLSPGPVTITGNARMQERPIGELGRLLERLGARVEYLANPGCPPLRITPPAPGALRPTTLEVGATQSGQFISGLLMVSPWLQGGLTLRIFGEVTSGSYVAMTLGLLARLGVDVRNSDDLRVLRVPGSPLAGFSIDIEPDASGATYMWAAGALLPGTRVRVEGLNGASLQGDARFPGLLASMGCRVTRHESAPAFIAVERGAGGLAPIREDLGETPDAALTLAVVACFANGTSVLRGLRTLRVKETDRIAALSTELRKVGVRVESPVKDDANALALTPPPGGVSPEGPVVDFETYNDHRMAMALSLLGLVRRGVRIRNPACVGKTYPTYWSDLARIIRSRGERAAPGAGRS